MHVSPDEESAERLRTQWRAWGDHGPLEVIISPYRVPALPLVNYLRTLRREWGVVVTSVPFHLPQC